MATKNTNKPAEKKAAAPKGKYNEKITKAIEIITATQPHVKTAYFNADGEYHFHKRPGFKAVPIVEEEDIDLEAEIEEDTDEDEIPAGWKTEF